jgi:uncharacterized protein
MNEKSLIDYAQENDVLSITKLLNLGADINQMEYGRSALHSTTLSNAVQAAKTLIDAGIKIDLKDQGSGATALHYCSLYNCVEIANFILNHGGHLDIPDNYGNQPLWTAIFNVKGRNERLAIVELLLTRGANKNYKNLAGRSPLDFANQVKYGPLLDILSKY